MSPIARRKKPESVKTEWKIRGKAAGLNLGGGAKSATVAIEDDRVRVTWLDGTRCASRVFTHHDLRELLHYVNGVLKRYPEMWLHMQDSTGSWFWCHLDGEDFTADNYSTPRGSVPWEGLEHAFQEALEALPSDEDD